VGKKKFFNHLVICISLFNILSDSVLIISRAVFKNIVQKFIILKINIFIKSCYFRIELTKNLENQSSIKKKKKCVE